MDGIFHLKNEKLTAMPPRSMREGIMGKSLEDALQSFFEKYPEIIPGAQIDPSSENPPRFVLLRREMPVGGWSLDHLLVDQRGVLTLVEAKLFQNTEARREVIGQIIEYAANAADAWAGGIARQKATEYWGNQVPPRNLDEILQEEFGEDLNLDDFWTGVEENLQAGKIRLIIAADGLRPEVRRMIEYLNTEMRNAEVLGLELKCYGNEQDSVVLVPRLIGQTQSAMDKKNRSSENTKWTSALLKEAYEGYTDQVLGKKLMKILEWTIENKSLLPAIAAKPVLAILGKSQKGLRFVSVFYDGAIYLFMSEKHYNSKAGRDDLIQKMKQHGFIDQELDPENVSSGRNLPKKITEMNDEEIDMMLEVFNTQFRI